MAFLFDIDGTLAQMSKVPYQHTGNEKMRTKNVEILRKLHSEGKKIIILTGRKSDQFRKITEEWLKKNNIPYDNLTMQTAHAAQKNAVFKKGILEGLIRTGMDIEGIYDDNPEVGQVARSLGIPYHKA